MERSGGLVSEVPNSTTRRAHLHKSHHLHRPLRYVSSYPHTGHHDRSCIQPNYVIDIDTYFVLMAMHYAYVLCWYGLAG